MKNIVAEIVENLKGSEDTLRYFAQIIRIKKES